MTEKRSLKVSQDKRTTLEVEIHLNPAQDESPVASELVNLLQLNRDRFLLCRPGLKIEKKCPFF